MSINIRKHSPKRLAACGILLLAVCGSAAADMPGAPDKSRIFGDRAGPQLPDSSLPTNTLPAVQNDRIKKLPDVLIQARSSVQGQLRIDNCRITHGLGRAVRFIDNSRSIDSSRIRFERVADEFSSVTRYTITGLAPGAHTLSVELTGAAGTECAGGRWLPESRRFSIKSNFSTVSHVNFQYERELVNTSIFGSLLTAQVERLFAGTQLRLNNHGPQRGRSNHLANDSTIEFPASLGGRVIRFDIPEFRSDPYRYYVNDINLSSLEAHIDGEFIRLTFHLEGAGVEFKGYCTTTNVLCLAGRDSSAPDVQWRNDPRIVVLLRPIAREGSITFGEVIVRVHGDIQARGVCSAIDVCHLATNYDREIQRTVQNSFRSFLNQTSVRRMVARGLRPVLDTMDIGHVMTARLEGGRLVLSYFPSA